MRSWGAALLTLLAATASAQIAAPPPPLLQPPPDAPADVPPPTEAPPPPAIAPASPPPPAAPALPPSAAPGVDPCATSLAGRYTESLGGGAVEVSDDGSHVVLSSAVSSQAGADRGSPNLVVTLVRDANGIHGETSSLGTTPVGLVCAVPLAYRVVRCEARLFVVDVEAGPGTQVDCAPAPGTPHPPVEVTLSRSGVPSADASAPSALSPSRANVLVTLGPGYQRLYDNNIIGLAVSAQLGVTQGGARLFGALDGLFGSTQYGLGTSEVFLGAGAERVFDPLSVGVEVRLGYEEINRVTSSEVMYGISLGMGAVAEADLMRSGLLTIFVGGRGGFDYVPSGFPDDEDAWLWSATAVIGIRIH